MKIHGLHVYLAKLQTSGAMNRKIVPDLAEIANTSTWIAYHVFYV